MPSNESLLRLRPAFYRIFVITAAAAGVIIFASIVAGEFSTWASRSLGTLCTLAVACISALIAISYTRRRERSGPALIGMTLTALAAAGLLPLIWIPDHLDVESYFFWALTSMIWALTWTFVLAIFTERLSARLVIVQRVTGLAMFAWAVAVSFMIWSGPEAERAEFWAGALAVWSVVGMLIVIALAHLRRSGVRSLVPMAQVASVLRAMDFYRQLGFRCENSFTPPHAPEPTWAWMEAPGGAQLMLTCAAEPLIPAQQGVLFYLYCDDLPAKHADLLARGIAAGPIERPFYAPRGEFRVTDPDGYALMLTHT